MAASLRKAGLPRGSERIIAKPVLSARIGPAPIPVR